MKIEIGDNNKIKNSNIGNNNQKTDKNNKILEIIIGIVITVIGGILLAIILKYLRLN